MNLFLQHLDLFASAKAWRKNTQYIPNRLTSHKPCYRYRAQWCYISITGNPLEKSELKKVKCIFHFNPYEIICSRIDNVVIKNLDLPRLSQVKRKLSSPRADSIMKKKKDGNNIFIVWVRVRLRSKQPVLPHATVIYLKSFYYTAI